MELVKKLASEVEDLEGEIAAYDKDIENMVRLRRDAMHRRDVLARCGAVVGRAVARDLEQQA